MQKYNDGDNESTLTDPFWKLQPTSYSNEDQVQHEETAA